MEMMQGAQTLDKVGTELAEELGKGSFFEVADDAPPKLDKRKVKKMKPAQPGLREQLSRPVGSRATLATGGAADGGGLLMRSSAGKMAVYTPPPMPRVRSVHC